MQNKISTCLWFDYGLAEEAARFYTGLIPGSEITDISRWGEGGPVPAGTVLTVDFKLAGQSYLALNGGPHFKLSPAVSIMVYCAEQAEVDRYWDALLAGGEPSQCGWLTDRFGVSWQVVPRRLIELVQSSDKAKAARVMQAMMQMVKLDIAGLERAAAGG